MGLEEYRRSISENKHAAILKAGRTYFLAHGYSGAAAADIAREADVSTATLYKHFSSKEALFAAVVKEAYNDAEIPPLPDNSNLEDTIVSVLNNYLITHFERNATALLRIVIAEVPGAPELARDMFNEFIVSRYEKMAEIVDQLIAHGTLKPHDSHFGVRLLIGAVKELFVWPALFDMNFTPPSDTEEKLCTIVQVFLARYAV